MTLVSITFTVPGREPIYATITEEDASQCALDALLCGDVYLRPTGLDEPTHERVAPREAPPA